MFSWLMNPWMLGLGGAAVSVPIIIHLLNKRRFRIVQWAAMEFLLDADKKNRRRVRVENLLLLALRCLLMFLIGLLLARPFLPSRLANLVSQDQQLERIVLLDDSLSSQVVNGSVPSFDAAKSALKRLVTQLAEMESSDDWLTVFVASRPEQPLLANEPVTRNTLATLIESIDALEATDMAVDYSIAMEQLRHYLAGARENVGRVVYVISDMRQRDWKESIARESQATPNRVLNELSREVSGTFVVDMASDNDDNLAVVDIRPLDLQVANKVVRFSVQVANFGASTLRDVRVLLQVDDAPPVYQTLASLAPGQVQELVFPYLFPSSEVGGPVTMDEWSEDATVLQNHRVRAEIDRAAMSNDELARDQLVEDSQSYYAAHVLEGIPVLLVDGDPQAISERSETHYLRSLAVPGTGLKIRTVTAGEFEAVSLSQYRVIFLCNIDEATSDRIESLKQWVRDGGGLVLMPGNKVRASAFNQSFAEDGQGLSPLELERPGGDPTMSSWVNFEVNEQVHPALKTIVESDRTSLNRVDIFSWWKNRLVVGEDDPNVTVAMRLSDPDQTPAMVERTMDEGRVVVFSIPADGDWSMWPSSPTYAPVMVDLIDYLVGRDATSTTVPIGGSLAHTVDLSVYENRVWMRDPGGDRVEAVASPVDSEGADDANVLYHVEFDQIARHGFYELGLKRKSGETDVVLYASELEPTESRLERLTEDDLSGDFLGPGIRRVSVDELQIEQVQQGNTEIWPRLLILILVVLGLEQFLGWYFGRRR